MAEENWEHVGGDDDARVAPRVERDPPPSFTAPTNSYTYRPRKRDLRLWQATTGLAKSRQGGGLLRQLKGESRTAAEVVMDDMLKTNDSIGLITESQDPASKIGRALHLAQRDSKQDPSFSSYVFQQLKIPIEAHCLLSLRDTRSWEIRSSRKAITTKL